MSVRTARIDGDCASVGVDRLVQPAGRLEDDPEVAIVIRAIGCQRQAPIQESDRFFVPSLLQVRTYVCLSH